MTTITIDRAVVEQALEAMEKATRFMSDADYRKLNESIDVLKAALAEPFVMQVRPSQFVELIKGKETMTGIPAYWSEWPNKEAP